MKQLLKYSMLLLVMFTVAACGYHLRGTMRTFHQVKAFSIQPDNPTEFFQRTFRRYLRDIGVKVEPASAKMYVIRLQPENYVREVLVIGTDALAKQESMIYTLQFEILSPYEGALGPQSVQVTRMLNLDPSQILGQNQEETVMLNEMREEASQQVYYRLNVIAEREQSEHKTKKAPKAQSSEEKDLEDSEKIVDKTQNNRVPPNEIWEETE